MKFLAASGEDSPIGGLDGTDAEDCFDAAAESAGISGAATNC